MSDRMRENQSHSYSFMTFGQALGDVRKEQLCKVFPNEDHMQQSNLGSLCFPHCQFPGLSSE